MQEIRIHTHCYSSINLISTPLLSTLSPHQYHEFAKPINSYSHYLTNQIMKYLLDISDFFFAAIIHDSLLKYSLDDKVACLSSNCCFHQKPNLYWSQFCFSLDYKVCMTQTKWYPTKILAHSYLIASFYSHQVDACSIVSQRF